MPSGQNLFDKEKTTVISKIYKWIYNFPKVIYNISSFLENPEAQFKEFQHEIHEYNWIVFSVSRFEPVFGGSSTRFKFFKFTLCTHLPPSH